MANYGQYDSIMTNVKPPLLNNKATPQQTAEQLQRKLTTAIHQSNAKPLAEVVGSHGDN